MSCLSQHVQAPDANTEVSTSAAATKAVEQQEAILSEINEYNMPPEDFPEVLYVLNYLQDCRVAF